MANRVTEEQIINKLATHARTIDGVRMAYGFAQNPDGLTPANLPAFVFFPAESTHESKAHFNVWTNTFNITGLLFVISRMDKGGTLRYIENDAIPFMQKIRAKFQEQSVYEDLLSLGLQKAPLVNLRYGAGGNLLTYNSTPYVGIICQWQFKETA